MFAQLRRSVVVSVCMENPDSSIDKTIVSPESSGDATAVSTGTGEATVVGLPAGADATQMAPALSTVDLSLLEPELTLNLSLHNPFALADARSENYLLFELAGVFKGQKLARPPVHLAVVLDKSGSMEGRPLEQVKEACRLLIDKMSPADTLSIITFAENVDITLAQSAVTKKEQLKAQLDLIRARGTTNLYGGMVAGANQLGTVHGTTHLSRIILLTDGEANEGVTEYADIIAKARQIKKDGYSISTIGVGIEYNEELMRGVAKNTLGNYYYIENVSDIPRVFEEELSTLFEVVAKKLELGIRLAKGVSLRKFYGREVSSQDGQVRLELPDVVAGRVQQNLAQLAFDVHPEARFRVMQAELSFEYLGQSTRTSLPSEAIVEFTHDKEYILSAINQKVDQVMRVKDVVAEISRAKELLAKDAGTATMIIDRAKTVLMQAGREGDATLVAEAMGKLERGEVEKADKTLGATEWELEE